MVFDKMVVVAEFLSSPVPLRVDKILIHGINKELMIISTVVSRDQMITSSVAVAYKLTFTFVLSIGTNELNIIIEVHIHVLI